MTTRPPSDFGAHYADYYDGTSQWREVCARGKADNVMRLWRAAGEAGRPRTLEIGCGDGAVLDVLRARGWDVHGLEVSPSAVEAARGRGLDVDAFDGAGLPSPDRAFDLAVLTHVVEHLESPRPLIREAMRVARWVFVEVPLEYHWRTPANFAWTDVGHVNLYDRKLLRQLLQSTGLTVIAEAVGGPPRRAYVYRKGAAMGTGVWAVREGLLRVAPPLARRLLTFHGAFLGLSRADPE